MIKQLLGRLYVRLFVEKPNWNVFGSLSSRTKGLIFYALIGLLCFALFVFICTDPPWHTFNENETEALFMGSGLGMAICMGAVMLIADGWF